MNKTTWINAQFENSSLCGNVIETVLRFWELARPKSAFRIFRTVHTRAGRKIRLYCKRPIERALNRRRFRFWLRIGKHVSDRHRHPRRLATRCKCQCSSFDGGILKTANKRLYKYFDCRHGTTCRAFELSIYKIYSRWCWAKFCCRCPTVHFALSSASTVHYADIFTACAHRIAKCVSKRYCERLDDSNSCKGQRRVYRVQFWDSTTRSCRSYRDILRPRRCRTVEQRRANEAFWSGKRARNLKKLHTQFRRVVGGGAIFENQGVIDHFRQ